MNICNKLMFKIVSFITEFDLSRLSEECVDGTFGHKCMYRCRCYRDQTCDKETGKCPRGRCAEGFWGPRCQLCK